MALSATIYRVSIQLSDADRNRYYNLQTTVAQHPSETAERLMARILAYAFAYEPKLTFTRGICAGDEPDLWIKEPDGRINTWIEVGLPNPERLRKARRQAGRIILFAYGPSRFRWENQYLAQLSAIRDLTVWGIDYDFLKQLVLLLRRAIDWSLTVIGNKLYLGIDDQTLESSLTLLITPND